MDIKEIFEMEAMNGGKWKQEVDKIPNSPDLIQELLPPRQVMMLAGRFQIGKTNELLHLMFSFTRQGNYHGLPVMPCPVLYIGWEGHPTKVKNRLDIIESLYSHKQQLHPWYFKMMKAPLYLDTEEGRSALADMVNKLTEKPRVILLDPFKRTVKGDYLKPHAADGWIKGATDVANDIGAAIIVSAHTRKITYYHNEPEDLLRAERVKGAGDLLDGINSAVIYAEEVGAKRVQLEDGYSKVQHATFGTVIKVIKAKDAQVTIPLLKVNFDKAKLRLAGQLWAKTGDGTILVESEGWVTVE